MPDGVEQPVNSLTAMDVIVILAGIALFARWLLGTSLGRQSLARSKPRRNCLAPFTPILLFLAWLVGGGLLQMIAQSAAGNLEHWQTVFLGQLVYSTVSLGTATLILILAKLDFARGLKGFGLRLHTAPRDLGLAFLTLLGVWPLVLAAMSLTIFVTRELFGREYQIPPHEALKLITESPALPLQVILVVMAVVVAPVVEEMLFRGLFQTTIRSYLQRPWPAGS